MNKLLTQYQRKIDKLPTNAKFILLASLLGVITLVWYYGFWQDLQNSMTINTAKIKELKTTISTLEKKLHELKIKTRTKPVGKKEKTTAKVLSPLQTKMVIHDLLLANKRLVLFQLKNLPPKAILKAQSQAKTQPQSNIFEHGIMIKFRSDYFSTMNYLREIKQLPWKIFWDKLEYKVMQYPTAEITLYIHTKSNNNDWIHL